MQSLYGNLHVVNVVMRMPFRKAYVHARLLPPRPAQDMVPRNAAPLRLASTDKGIRPLPHVLPIIIIAVKEGECIVAMRNAVVQVMSPCAAQVAVTHAVSVYTDRQDIIGV